MWPRPRVGQWIKLKKNGRVVEVVVVRSAREVLKTMTETSAMMMGPTQQAIYGMHWLEVYYEAEYIAPGPTIGKATPNDVEAILDLS